MINKTCVFLIELAFNHRNIDVMMGESDRYNFSDGRSEEEG